MKKNIKKLIFSLALAAGLTLGTAAVYAVTNYQETVDGITYTYEIVDNGAMITEMIPVPGGIYIMPDTLGGHPVTEFYARIDNRWLERVMIPSSLRSLSADAFGYCDNLNYNEYDNGYYLGTAENPYHALIKAKNEDITSCQINSDTKVIADYAFKDCSNLTSVTIPEGVKTIGVYAFWNCSRLESVTIPSSVIYMGREPFLNCDNLNYNEYDNGLYLGTAENPYYALIKAKNKYITSCQINSDTKVIAGVAFEGCNNLTSIDIPENITRIEMYTFYNCNSLTSVTIPKNVTFIGTMTFYYDSLNDAFIPNECELGNYVFTSRAKIWRYRVNSTQGGKTHVTITSVEDGNGNPISVSGCLTYNAMGDDYVIDAVEVEGVQLGHTLAHTPAKAATCTTEGNAEYWTCSHCGKYFSDAAGTTEIAENYWILPVDPSRHFFDYRTMYIEPTCTENGQKKADHCQYCNKCILDDSHQVVEEADLVIPATGHNMTAHAAVPATCTKEGNIAYWYCNNCKKYFSDENAETEIAEGDWVTSVIPHNFGSEWYNDENNHWHKCTVCEADSEPEAHTWKISEVTKEVTDTEKGELKCVCETCGGTKTEDVPALENYVNDPNLEQTVDKDGEKIKLIVQDPYGVLPLGVHLEIDELKDDLKAQLDDKYKIENVSFYDIKLYTVNADGLKTYISGELACPVRVLWQIPEGWDEKDMEAVRITVGGDIDFDESIVTINGVKYLAFWTNHFSPYASIDKLTPEEEAALKEAAAKKVEEKNAVSEGKSGELKTGETIDLYLTFSFVLLAALLILIISLKRKKELMLNEK